MNQPHDEIDPLEAELESLRPAPLRAELAARIGREVAGQAPQSGPRCYRPGAASLWIGGAAAAAACVVAALTWREAGPPEANRAVVQATQPTTVYEAADERPALSSYRRAASLSAGALDELLDRQSARVLAGPGTAAPPVTVSSRASMLP